MNPCAVTSSQLPEGTPVLQNSVQTDDLSYSISDIKSSALPRDKLGPDPDHNDRGGYSSHQEGGIKKQNIQRRAEIVNLHINEVGFDNSISVHTEIKVEDNCEVIDCTETNLDIHKETQYKMELERVEKLRRPKFQTIPAFEKRVKQEVQWKAATRIVKMKSYIPPLFPYKIPRKSHHTVTMPARTNNSWDQRELISAPPIVSSTTMIAKTKKYLSAANHFPANSRMFNRSLQQLQNQAEAISSTYLNTAAVQKTSLLPKLPLRPIRTLNQLLGEGLQKTINPRRFLKDDNNNLQQFISSSSPVSKSAVSVMQANPVVVNTSPLPVYSLHPRQKIQSTSSVPRLVQTQPYTVIQKINTTLCYNCQKLTRILPNLAHSMSKLGMRSGRVLVDTMVVMCEVCGCLVRETVIIGDHIAPDPVASAHLSAFLSNTPGQGQEESQNTINLEPE